MTIPKRTLGRTGLQISEIWYGAWSIGGGWGATDDAEALRALHCYLDYGGNFLDTAYTYGDGHSEQLIAKDNFMTEQLWAPWRLKYIEGADRAQGCIFCDFPRHGEAEDEKHLIVYRGPHAYIILNAFPYSNGHLMVVPFRHTDSLDSYTDPELLDVMQLTRLSRRLLIAAFKPDGCNLGVNMGRVAGAGIADHLHWHIVPRWNGDTNFMPVLADVRVIPESLLVVFQRLRVVLPSALAQERLAEPTDADGNMER